MNWMRRKIMPVRRIAPALLVCMLVPFMDGCQTTTSAGAVGAQRSQLLLVSSQQLEEMAAQTYTKLKTDAAAAGALNTDRAMVQRVRAIAARLVAQTSVFRADAPRWSWEVNVIRGKDLNAYCMPGGKIMVYSGLIDTLNLSDDELAVVLGHEISHALREHTREQVSQAMAAQAAIDVGTEVFGLGQSAASIADIAYQTLIATRFSRTDESEADRIGLELTARAGYDPRAGIALWQKMVQAKSGGGMPEFLSSHPADASRVQQIEALLPAVMPLYTAARRGEPR
ncbi:MAG: M48 family metallopeptidase [Rhodoferax sp.]|nr:M48 family metallopeptidase [Rhodoferax sp.]MDP3652486.1 M48 family metallopeptidase [Rhodoferax sp.]